MAHGHGPGSWTPLAVARWAFSSIFMLLIVTFLEENVRHAIEQKHWNEFLSTGAAMVPDLSPLLEGRLFWFVLGLSAGVSIALWLIWLFPPANIENHTGAPPRQALQILYDETDAKFVRPVAGLHGSTGERFWVGVHNASNLTLHGVTLRAQEGWFVTHTIAVAHGDFVRPATQRDRVPIIVDIAHLDPGATEIVELFGLDYNSSPNKNDVLGDVRRFTLEARARDVTTVTQEFEFDPMNRPMIIRSRPGNPG